MFALRHIVQFICVIISSTVALSSSKTIQWLHELTNPTVGSSLSFMKLDVTTLDHNNIRRKDGNPSIFIDPLAYAIFPIDHHSFSFNEDGDQEWRINRYTDTTFIIYGKNLNGTVLSFTSHTNSCLIERKDYLYQLTVNDSDPYPYLYERASFKINLPYYDSKLFICLQSTNASYPIHQGDRPTLKLIITRRTIPIWATLLLLIFLLSLSGLFSGLNLGLMSWTPENLMLIQEAGAPNDRKYAKRIYPVRKRGNFLLCTILLGNVLVNSTITILLDTLISGLLAVTGATFAIVIFGEIIPQAVCSRHGLKIGSKTIVLTRIFMVITSPIAFPLSKILDCVLGEEVGPAYTRDQMSALLKHTQTTGIDDSEKNIMTGVLSLKTKKISDIMTHLRDVFMVSVDQIIDDELILMAYRLGFSRIPVYEKERENIIGIINIRDFALLDTESGRLTVQNLMNFCKHRYGKAIVSTDSCFDVFNTFKKEQYHLGVVVEYDNVGESDPKARAIGIVTFEDIIEEMIQEEIVDETDVYTDNRGKVRNRLLQTPDITVFTRQGQSSSDSMKISAQMKVAIFQFLSTTVEPFSAKFISSHILTRLLNTQLYQKYEYDERKVKNGEITYIYEYGKLADYFILILNGQAELMTGKENIVSIVGPFSYFGVNALCNPGDSVEDVLRPNDAKHRPFIPDFSLRVCEELDILRIHREHWLAAIRATFLENEESKHGSPTIANAEREKIDNVSQPDNRSATSNELTNRYRSRSMSITPIVAAEYKTAIQKQLLHRSRARSISSNAQQAACDHETNCTKNTTESTGKQQNYSSGALRKKSS